MITNNLDSNLKFVVNMILLVKALLSYPLPYFASVELLEASLFLPSEHSTQSEEFSHDANAKPVFMRTCYDLDGDLRVWAVCLRILLIVFTLFLAIFIPHFAILMGLIGSITGVALSLIWPCYFHLHLKWPRLKWYQIALDVAIIGFGVLISLTGIYYSSIALHKALAGENSPLKNPDYYKKNAFFGPNGTSLAAAAAGLNRPFGQ